jgi:cysteinyl-tRNA synthetase
VNTWMHNGPVRVDNEKMSKSLGNFFTIREVLKQYPAEVIRYFLVSSHYRSHINYSEENLKTAWAALERFYHALKGLDLGGVAAAKNTAFERDFHTAMADDFNTPEALGVLFDLVREINRLKGSDPQQALSHAALLHQLADVLGILASDPESFLREGGDDVDAAHIDALIAQRNQARADKNWGEADRIRAALKALNVVVEDKNGVSTWRIER